MSSRESRNSFRFEELERRAVLAVYAGCLCAQSDWYDNYNFDS